MDIDDNALIAARDNAANNHVALALRHSKEPLDERFDIVIANILTNPLCVLAPLLAGRIAAGGRIALAGVLAPQAPQVIDAYAPWLALQVGAERDGWVRLEGRRAADAAVPSCATHFRVTPEQLKARTGRVRCGECQNVFNALDSLIEEPVVVPASMPLVAVTAAKRNSRYAKRASADF